MNRRIFPVAVALAVLASNVTWSYAQSRGGTGTSAFGSGFGTSSFGSSGFGSTGFGNTLGRSGFGSTGMGGFGTSGFGGGGFGSSGFGNSAFGGQGFNSFGSGQGGQNFVGRDSGDMNAVMSQMGRAGTQFFNTMSRNFGNRGNRGRQQDQSGENERPPVRVRLEVGFAPTPQTASTLATAVNARLQRLAVDHNLGQSQVTSEGDTVVLRGTAESESQRRILEQLVMLEPGVRAVRNEIIVAGTTDESLPAESSTTP